MSIVSRCFALAVFALAPPLVRAHPVAQGWLEVSISPDKVQLRARVSLEQVMVAASFTQPPLSSLPQAIERHRDYLLQHLRVLADDRLLPGRLISFEQPTAGPEATHVRYDFEFALPTPARSFRVEQDVLNEFEYAPGNRWEATYVTRVQEGDRVLVEGALLTAKTPLLISSASPASSLSRDYLEHGIHHILSGYDHLLFISALALAVISFWELIKVIAAFTLAHTLTLTLSVFDLVRLPAHVVEPMIALSIIIVALQNVCWPARSRGAPRLAVAFFFGLFHGLGFAGGLVAAMEGLPGLSVGLAILAFSLGVEIGHQFVVLPVFGLTRLVRREFAGELLRRGGSAAICAAGLFYFAFALRSFA